MVVSITAVMMETAGNSLRLLMDQTPIIFMGLLSWHHLVRQVLLSLLDKIVTLLAVGAVLSTITVDASVVEVSVAPPALPLTS